MGGGKQIIGLTAQSRLSIPLAGETLEFLVDIRWLSSPVTFDHHFSHCSWRSQIRWGLFSLVAVALLDLADNFTGLAQAFHHLLAFFAPSDRIVALFEQIIQLLCPIHLLEKFSLHFVFGMSVRSLAQAVAPKYEKTYCTRVNMIALGTMSIIVLLTMLK